jgi:hypothetical protein
MLDLDFTRKLTRNPTFAGDAIGVPAFRGVTGRGFVTPPLLGFDVSLSLVSASLKNGFFLSSLPPPFDVMSRFLSSVPFVTSFWRAGLLSSFLTSLTLLGGDVFRLLEPPQQFPNGAGQQRKLFLGGSTWADEDIVYH